MSIKMKKTHMANALIFPSFKNYQCIYRNTLKDKTYKKLKKIANEKVSNNNKTNRNVRQNKK